MSKDRTALLDALGSSKAVAGLTHVYYRYPARFSPDFAREAIREFTKPGELVLDPFMGGGTSAVEALAEGRCFVGCDLNELAHFVAKAKTTVLSPADEKIVLRWMRDAERAVASPRRADYLEATSRFKGQVHWTSRRAVAALTASARSLASPQQRVFAQCSVLSAAQAIMDCKQESPTVGALLAAYHKTVNRMLEGNRFFRERLLEHFPRSRLTRDHCHLVCDDAANLGTSTALRTRKAPRLILTSPPYMGVHVLYHRWQILGRKETALPYWIAGRSDGHASSYYTFADRRSSRAAAYLARLRACFSSIKPLMDRKTRVAQLVAFAEAEIQLPMYLRALNECGLELCETLVGNQESIVHRSVPNRKWYALLANQSTSSKEYLLVHRKKGAK